MKKQKLIGKLTIKKMNITHLDAIKGGHGHYRDPLRDHMTFTENTLTTSAPSEQPMTGGGGGCYSDAPTSCLVCV